MYQRPGFMLLPGLLSAQERQIARLAAEGPSNQEIGERLYLSPRAVVADACLAWLDKLDL